MDEIKSVVRSEVYNTYDHLNYDLSKFEAEERVKIKNKIDMLYVIYNSIDVSGISLEKRQLTLLEALKQVDENDPDTNYFAINSEGELMRSETDNNFNGIEYTDLSRLVGKENVNDILAAIQKDDGVFFTYKWPKVKEGIPLDKISYCRYFSGYDMIVATGKYNEDIDRQLKTETFDRISNFYKEEDLYMFILDYDGTVLVHPDKSLIGNTFYELDNKEGIIAHEAMMTVIKDTGEGFVEYKFNKKNSAIISKKVTYVKNIDKWNVYLGMGFYLDDIEAEIQKQTTVFLRKKIIEFLLILIVFIITAVFLTFMIRKGFRLQKQQIKEDEVVFTELFQTSNQGLVIVTLNGKVLFSNRKAVSILSSQIAKRFGTNGILKGEHLSENRVSILLDDGERRYLDYQRREFNYLNRNVYIYYLTDITEDFISMNNLKEQALNDPLTGLPNRRQLNADFNKLRNRLNGKTSICLTMLDIDHFKNVNDTFGHETGDKILKLLADVFTSHSRSSDRLYRYGGEEFVLCLKEVNTQKAINIINRIKDDFGRKSMGLTGESITFSAGLINLNETKMKYSLPELLKLCDELLYRAKRNGRNSIETDQ
jgi:diguanylate cyclase (GGDEF)-like protein